MEFFVMLAISLLGLAFSVGLIWFGIQMMRQDNDVVAALCFFGGAAFALALASKEG